MTVQTKSVLTCPECGAQKEEDMPTESCKFLYRCAFCDTTIKPLAGDCCVFCSYGTVPCPPIQLSGRPAGGSTSR